MADGAKLVLTELDFDAIKTSLKEFIKADSQFTDYNFEGSGLSSLINLLAYNTHMNAFYANMLTNESFLDSAVKRSSVVSRAKMIGYTPRSATAATAVADIFIVPSDNPAAIVIPKGTSFVSSSGGFSYNFVTVDTYQTINNNGEYKFEAIPLKEGVYQTFKYTVNKATNPNLIFEIPDLNVDVSTLRVRVQTSATDFTTENFQNTDKILDVTGTSPVYWVQEGYSGKFEIYFGDGIVGKTLNDGNVVIMDYVVTNKSAANGCATFAASGAISGYSNISVITKAIAAGGAERESIQSIKFNAPKSYVMQNRIVTAPDYKTFISRNYPIAESVSVWGGEENNPPVYGKVFISIKPPVGYVLTLETKTQITRDIKERGIVPITVEFVDPDYTYVGIATTSTVNLNKTFRTADQLKALIQNGIFEFFSRNLGKFSEKFVYSKFIREIDQLDSGIIGSNFSFRLMKRFSPMYNTTQTFSLNFANAIEPGSISSTTFTYNANGSLITGHLRDQPSTMPPSLSGTGKIHLYNFLTGELVNSDFGTIDYSSGMVVLNKFNVVTITDNDDSVFVYAMPQNNDIVVGNNNILIIDSTFAKQSINRQQGVATVNLINEG